MRGPEAFRVDQGQHLGFLAVDELDELIAPQIRRGQFVVGNAGPSGIGRGDIDEAFHGVVPVHAAGRIVKLDQNSE